MRRKKWIRPVYKKTQVFAFFDEKMAMKWLFLSLLIVGCAHHAPQRDPSSVVTQFSAWGPYLRHEFGNIADLFTDPTFLQMPWKISSEIAADGKELPPNKVQEVGVACADKNLYPTHPFQDTKEYIFSVAANYDYTKLPGTSEACITSTTSKKFCLRAQTANVVIVSDTYEDSCGNMYRGYWVKHYRSGGNKYQTEDNMGTLVAKGRTIYEKTNSEFAGEVYSGYTYPTPVSEFAFLGKLLPRDALKIQTSLQNSVRMGYVRQGKIFISPKNLK